MTRQEFAQGIALLTGSVGKPMPDEQLAAWYALLSDLTAEQLRRGIVQTLHTHQYAGFPPLGTVRTNALAGTQVSAKDRPLAAWQALLYAIGHVGVYDSPNFDDAIINAVVRELGGWPILCDTPTEGMQWLEKRFCAIYSALCGANLPEEQTRRLAGTTEITNARNGYSMEPVRVAQIRCLTVDSNQQEPVRTRLVENLKQPKVLPSPNTAVGVLAEKMNSVEDEESTPQIALIADKSPDAERVDEPAMTLEEQTAALKRHVNLTSDHLKTG
jgi:hypothetical protein